MTTTATHPTHAALLEAIRAEPADDTVRLALADWYEENGDPAWAELIHVQVELARQRSYEPIADTPREVDALWKKRDREIDALSARSDDLLAEHEPRWRRGAKCERCENGTYTFFPSTSHPPRKKTCPFCHGTGWSRWWLAEYTPVIPPKSSGKIHEQRWRHRVHFERGFIEQVDANLADIFDGERATEWALAVARGEPMVRRLGVVDRQPGRFSEVHRTNGPGSFKGHDTHFWLTDGGWFPESGPNRLPKILRPYLGGYIWDCGPSPRYDLIGHYFDSPAAANTALATAAWQVVREQISG